MAEFVEDDQIYPAMIAIAENVRLAIIQNGLPVITNVSVQPGIEPVYGDKAGNGKSCDEIVVNMTGAGPLTPVASEVPALAGCQPELMYVVAVAVLRCAPTPKGNPPRMPSAADQLNATRLHLADMRASKRGICVALKDYAYDLSEFIPYGPDGAVVGGIWVVTVGPRND